MSFLQTLASAFKGGGHSRVPLARTISSPWFFAETARAPFEYNGAVRRAYLDNPVAQRAVRLVAEGIGGAPLAPCDPALARLVGATSAGQALLETLTAQLLLHGNAYVRLPPPSEDETMLAFDDLPYPLALGRDATVIPEFSTSVAVTASGFERRNSLWSDARLRFDVGPGIRSEAELGELLGLYRARRGAARGFRLRDPSDFSSNAMVGAPTMLDQLLGTGDGVRTRFALVKRYGDGTDAQLRRITRPVANSLLVSIDGIAAAAGWALDPFGELVFATPPPSGKPVRAGFLFDVPVRFAEDRLEISGAAFAAGEAPSVPIVEVREAS